MQRNRFKLQSLYRPIL